MIDLKIVEEREIGGLIYQKVRFYEGVVSTENETRLVNNEFVIEPITRYRRTGLIEEREYYYEQATG